MTLPNLWALRGDVPVAPPECSVIRLSAQAATAFDEALASPAIDNPRLAEALQRARRFRFVR